MKFYSSSTGGFYDSDIHGDRAIQVPDPDWVRPTKTITLLPGEQYNVGDEHITNDGDDARDFDVPDMDVEHPTVTVDNPNCKLPLDAKEIPFDDYQNLFQAQSEGKVISADEQGMPIATDPPPLTADQIRASYEAAAQRMLDSVAQSWGYDSISRAITYLNSKVPQWKAEAEALNDHRDNTWLAAHQIDVDVTNGAPPPTDEADFLSRLPPPPERPTV